MKIYLIKTYGDELSYDIITLNIALSKEVARKKLKEYRDRCNPRTPEAEGYWIEEFEVTEDEAVDVEESGKEID